MTTRNDNVPGFGVCECASCQDMCDLLDARGWSNRTASRVLGMNEKTIAKIVNAPGETRLTRSITLALAAVKAGIYNLD